LEVGWSTIVISLIAVVVSVILLFSIRQFAGGSRIKERIKSRRINDILLGLRCFLNRIKKIIGGLGKFRSYKSSIFIIKRRRFGGFFNRLFFLFYRNSLYA